jgi:cation:H+ antiporter
MIEILQSIFYIVLSVVAIGKGSDWFTDALIPIARKLGTSTVSVGLILVSVAVSLPEVFIAVEGVIKQHSQFSFGVTVGSIACNIALMTGLCAFVKPLKVTKTIILRDGIFSITVPILVFAIAAGGQITKLEGFAFLVLFIPYLINVFMQEQQDSNKKALLREIEIELDLLGFSFAKIRDPWIAFVLGLGLLLLGTHIFTNQVIDLARILKMDELFIGMTIGAIGPSIPNIMAAYQATRKGMLDVAVSATLGSNIFTLLVTLGILAIISPMVITQQTLVIDLPAIMIMSLLLFIFMISGRVISRVEGGILIGCYLIFLILKFLLK